MYDVIKSAGIAEKRSERFKDLIGKACKPTNNDPPRKEEQQTLGADACDRKIQCLLIEKQDYDVDRPIGYWTKKPNYR